MSNLDKRIFDHAPFDLKTSAKIIVAAFVGSQSHGTWIPKEDDGVDDVDIMGVVLPPVDRIIGLDGWDHWVQIIDELDVNFFALRKTVSLWLKSNPNVLGLLWMRDEDIIMRSPEFDAFRDIREAFICKQVADAFGGYAFSQLRQIQRNRHEGYMGTRRKELVEQFGYDIKHAAHLVRLLRMAIEFMRDGVINVYRTNDAEELKAIKRGEWTLERVQMSAADMFADLDELKSKSRLPDKPDRKPVNDLLIDITRSWVTPREEWDE